MRAYQPSWLALGVVLALSASCGSSDDAPSPGGTEPADEAVEPSQPPGEIILSQIEVGDFTFDARMAGPDDGEVVLLLHGFPQTSHEWRHQLRGLGEAGYRAVAPDQRGYSPGARPEAIKDYEIPRLVEDIVGIADAVGADRFHLVGHDWGAIVAWAVAVDAPDRVITVNPVSVPHLDAFARVLRDPASCQPGASAYFDIFVQPDSEDAFLAEDSAGLRAIYARVDSAAVDEYVRVLGSKAANATVKQTGRFENRESLGKDKRDALTDAGRHADTATVIDLDVQGRPFQSHRMLEATEDQGAWLTTHHELDIQGRETGSADPRLFERGLSNFGHSHDMSGNEICTRSADAGSRWTLPDVLGRPTHEWDERHHRVSTSYDELGRPYEVRLWHEADARHDGTLIETMVHGEDLPREAAVAGNLLGQVVRHYDEAGVVHFDAYDIGGRPSARRRQLRLDFEGVASWADRATGTSGILSELRGHGVEHESFDSRQTHDALGRLVSETHADGSTAAMAYHPRGELKSLGAVDADGTPTRFVEETEYDERGLQTRIEYGNGVTTTYEHDHATGQLLCTNTVRASDSATLQHVHFTHDPVGNPTRVRDLTPQGAFGEQKPFVPVSRYTYDALHRLVRATGREHLALSIPEASAGRAEHPDRREMVHLNDPGQLRAYERTYIYDKAANLTSVSHCTLGPQQSRPSFTRKFTVASTSNRTVPGKSTDGVDSHFDAQGNRTKIEGVRWVRWNHHDQIASVVLVDRTGGAPDAEYYAYDASGQRVRKVTRRETKGGTLVEENLYIGAVEIQRTRLESGEASRLTRERHSLHVFDGQHRVAVTHRWKTHPSKTIDEPQVRYQLESHLGTASLELTSDGRILTHEEYYPFGGTAVVRRDKHSEVSRKERRYSGKEQDDSTGLYCYGARYYAPWLMRWMSPDPAGTVDGLNLYAFARNNPARFEDRLGLDCFPWRRNPIAEARAGAEGLAEPRAGVHLPVPDPPAGYSHPDQVRDALGHGGVRGLGRRIRAWWRSTPRETGRRARRLRNRRRADVHEAAGHGESWTS